VTVLPVGTEAGAVYVVAMPLAVVVALNAPQSEPPQVTVHLTPPFAESWLTVAVNEAEALVCREAGGVPLNATLIGCGGGGGGVLELLQPTSGATMLVAIMERM